VDEALAYLAFDPVFQRVQVLREAAPWPHAMAHQGTLVQVLVNLLSNASKFVAPGVVPRITLRAGCAGPQVRLEVEDNGIGIPERDHQRIFKVFERLHGPESYAGTGIGLALVHKGVERMGGEVGLQSQVGQGSCFWIVLPVAEAKA
jgi:signal transduction histidine kinase